jgi:glycine cleavage system H protein
MSSTPNDLHYSKDHEWVRVEGDIATVGITDYAQHALGDIVYVELPRVGQVAKQFASIGVVESVKSVSDLFTPLNGEIVAVNTKLADEAALVNREPFGEGWMIKIKLDGDSGLGNLMDAAAYETLTAEG